ncbi:MAG TPA: hypothetical protein VGR35_01685 [Tepidisphaeraceae bacterium]|nr:hypothetical protein [Tepidisphaeraceae bacterium]
MRVADQRILIVTRPTRLKGLLRRYSTRGLAKFAMKSLRAAEEEARPAARERRKAKDESIDADFMLLEREDQTYDAAVEFLRRELDDLGPNVQVVERDFLPVFVFGPHDVVVTVGQDGLVANTAKYVRRLPIVTVNPDPEHIDGILLPFKLEQARLAVHNVLRARARFREVTLAEATLPDGQRLLAFNDFFIGSRTHVSARYRLEHAGRSELQISSGVIVSTGAGSTGWLSSVFNMANGLRESFGTRSGAFAVQHPMRLDWSDLRLIYVVREPFASKQSGITMTAGMLEIGEEIVAESLMGENGVIFSDGIETDYLDFNSGAIARVRAARERAMLAVG